MLRHAGDHEDDGAAVQHEDEGSVIDYIALRFGPGQHPMFNRDAMRFFTPRIAR